MGLQSAATLSSLPTTTTTTSSDNFELNPLINMRLVAIVVACLAAAVAATPAVHIAVRCVSSLCLSAPYTIV